MSSEDDKQQARASEIGDEATQSLVMTDWTANVNAISVDRQTLLWELILQSFLREKTFIQDEAPAQSQRLADWFSEPNDFRLLEELIAMDKFVFICREPQSYRTDLQTKAERHPIEARAQEIEETTGVHGERFHVSDAQRAFYTRLDTALHLNRAAHRNFSKEKASRTHRSFQQYLVKALLSEDEGVQKWLQDAFRLGDQNVLRELASYITKPAEAIKRVKESPHVPNENKKFHPKSSTDPLFTRHLGHLLAASYPPF